MNALTVGMASFKDFVGTYFTLKILRDYHPAVDTVVVNTTPTSQIRQTRGVTLSTGGRHLHRPDLVGTAAPRDAIFRVARTPWVLVCDSHVEFHPGSIQSLLDYIAENPESNDLISGPLIGDDGKATQVFWRPVEQGGLWGEWDNNLWLDPETRRSVIIAPSKAEITRTPQGRNLSMRVVYFDMAGRPITEFAGRTLPDIPWNRTDEVYARLAEFGLVRPMDQDGPVEIPMQGLGVFAMRRDAWPGFHPKHRAFGGEEGYIAELVRRRGGRAICLPGLKWSHVFRGPENPTPYSAPPTGHVRNLLLNHRELGIDPMVVLAHGDAKKMQVSEFLKLAKEAEAEQPFGEPCPRPKRLKLLGIWYSDNSAPETLLRRSLQTITEAHAATVGHDVEVVVCPWKPILGHPFAEVLAEPPHERKHATIVRQQRQCLEWARSKGFEFDAVVCLEHDVLYPADYFDRMGNLLRDGAPVAVNLDYIGLNQTGWLKVIERHEPLHQIAMRRDIFEANLDRAAADCERQGWCYLEPSSAGTGYATGDRSDWARFPAESHKILAMPSVHVTHEKNFTGHAAVCYEKSSTIAGDHPYWGAAVEWSAGACSTCGKKQQQPAAPQNNAAPPNRPSKTMTFDELVTLAKEGANGPGSAGFADLETLAAKCESVLDLGPAVTATVPAIRSAGQVRIGSEVHPRAFDALAHLIPGVVKDDGSTADLVVTGALKSFLVEPKAVAERASRYLVVLGSSRANTREPVRDAIGRLLAADSSWSILREHDQAGGVTVLTRDPAEKEAAAFGLSDYARYAKAELKHRWNGGRFLPLEIANERMEICLKCEHRTHDGSGKVNGNCAACNCYLWEKGTLAGLVKGEPGKVWYPSEVCGLAVKGETPKWGPRNGEGVDQTREELAAALLTRPEFAPIAVSSRDES